MQNLSTNAAKSLQKALTRKKKKETVKVTQTTCKHPVPKQKQSKTRSKKRYSTFANNKVSLWVGISKSVLNFHMFRMLLPVFTLTHT